ncbi:phosphopantetheine-binding protein [Microlunatus lacustris]
MTLTLSETRSLAADRQALTGSVKELLVDRLALDVEPARIADDQPLFGRGLELDSIDTLELAMAVEDQYGAVITDDDTTTLLSLNRLVDHIAENQT